MEVNFEDLSDDEVNSDQLKDPDIRFDDDDFDFDVSFFEKKQHEKVIINTHKKLMEFKTKFEQTGLYSMMDLNVEYRNYYNSLKTVTVDDNVCILDIPIIKMDIEQIDDIIIKKQEMRSSKDLKQSKTKSQFKWKFGH